MLTSRWLGGTPTTSLPYSRIWPAVGSSKPPIIRSVVVLPQPDGPSSEKNSPSPITRSTPSTAVTTPWRDWKRFSILTSSMAVGGAPAGIARGAAATSVPAFSAVSAVGLVTSITTPNGRVVALDTYTLVGVGQADPWNLPRNSTDSLAVMGRNQ